jgi:acetolactate synthase-1/2/3 large subunit
MTAANAFDQLAEALSRAGTRRIFGLPGGGPNLALIEAARHRGVDFVLAHGETAACIMASTHGYLTGCPSVAIVTRGPGAAAAVNGAAQATLDRHPLVLVTDTVPAADAPRVPHQRIRQGAMLAPVTKCSVVATDGTDAATLDDLLALTLAPPAGAVHLDLDPAAPDPTPAPVAPPAPTPPAEPELAAAAAMVASADHPLVVVGLGALDRPVELARALERFGAPVLMTYQAVGALPSEHRLAAGLFTNGASERPLLDRSDLVVAIGLDPVEPIPAPWDVSAPVLSLASHPTTDPYLPIAREVVGEPSVLADRILVGPHLWAPDDGHRHRTAVRAALAAHPAPVDGGLSPVELVRVAASRIPDRSTVTVDAGAHFLAVMPFWPVAEPRRLLISNGLATMGYALPAAIGAALARPGEPVLCLVGDGGLGMTMAELETAARLDLPLTVVVFNDSALSLIRIKQGEGGGGPGAVAYRPTDFAALARAQGLDATAVSDRDGIDQALSGGWDRPRLIDARIDPGSYPHLLAVTRG